MSKRRRKNPIDAAYSKHHRKPKSRGGGEGANISVVPDYKHKAFHQMFGNMQPSEIAAELSIILASLNTTWLDPEYMLIAVRRQ